MELRPGFRAAHGAEASIFRVGRSIWWPGWQSAGNRLSAPSGVRGQPPAGTAEDQNLRVFRPGATPVVRVFVRIALSDYKGLWQVRILLPRPSAFLGYGVTSPRPVQAGMISQFRMRRI
jgi:hypothetical protein